MLIGKEWIPELERGQSASISFLFSAFEKNVKSAISIRQAARLSPEERLG